MMRYLLEHAMPEYPSWRHYFEFVICSAQKPRWFQEGRPLMERDGDVLRHVRSSLERGKAYEGGNLAEFERLLDVRGSSILYVGDHIYGDILRSKKETSWYTAMIIQELDAEIARARGERSRSAAQARARGTPRRARGRAPLLSGALQGALARAGNGRRQRQHQSDAERLRAKRAVERVRAELRTNLAEYDGSPSASRRSFTRTGARS